VKAVSPQRLARQARQELAALARPVGEFDASRYFRGTRDLGFYNVGTSVVRSIGKRIAREHRDDWSLEDAVAFAEVLVADRYLEVKGLGIEVLACWRRDFTPALLKVWKRWLAEDRCDNWATTDALCGMCVGPLLQRQPQLAATLAAWATHRNMWVRRASAVGILKLVSRGDALDQAYATAQTLHADGEDLIQKAVGWMLREAGRADRGRLERYLLTHGPRIPRTTIRYAIEHFPTEQRRALLAQTRG
jgi:3-methyladenine DNA glycosylase AlkD